MKFHAVRAEILEHHAHCVLHLANAGYAPVVALLLDLLPGAKPGSLVLDQARQVVAGARKVESWERLMLAAEVGHDEVLVPEEVVFAREAIEAGNPERLERLLRVDPGLATSPTDWDMSLLHHAAAPDVQAARVPGQLRMVNALLHHGASPGDRGPFAWGSTPLMQAASVNHVEVALRLLDAGAPLEDTGSLAHAGTALSEAVFFGMREVSQALIQRGAALYSLPVAAGAGDLDAARGLLGEPWGHPDGCWPDDTDPAQAALSLAAVNGQTDLVRWLLDEGVDVNALFRLAPFQGESTALIRAADAGFVQVVELLLERGAEISATDGEYGESALGHCVWSATEGHPHLSPTGRDHTRVVSLLLAAGASASDWARETAAGHERQDLVEMFA